MTFYELEIYDNGTGFASINNVLYPHSENMVVLAKPGEKRFTIGSFNCYAVHFTCGDKGICEAVNSLPDCIFAGENIKKRLIGLMQKLTGENAVASFAAIADMLNIINASKPPSLVKRQTIPDRIIRVKEYIDSNYRDGFDLEQLQKTAGLSINYVRNLFSRYYGITVQQYIIELRLSYVKKLISSTDMSVCDIAYEAGFNSQSHMNYMFKARFGISPARYKKTAAYLRDG